MTTPCNPKIQGAQCWICPRCHDDKHHQPDDEHCLKQQISNLMAANKDAIAWESAAKADLDEALTEIDSLRTLVAELEDDARERADNLERADLYDFEMGYVFARSDPYYYIRWDLEKPATIRAATMEEAHSKLRAVLGEPDRHQRIVTRVKEIRTAVRQKFAEAEKEGGAL